MNLSEHITHEEATFSATALRMKIDNKPDAATLLKMEEVAGQCFEPIRAWYGKPIKINSFYRSPALNAAVHGASNSQHVKGEAIDMSGGSKEENRKIYEWAKLNLTFDQLINEFNFSWIHVSYAHGKNRNQTLIVV